MTAPVDELVTDWLTLPDIAEALDIPFGRVRRLVEEGHLVGIRRGQRPVFQVPAALLVPKHLADPAHKAEPQEGEGLAVLTSLHGTVTVLADAGFTSEEILVWLFSPSEELGMSPLEALKSGKKAHVRQIAQSLG